MPQFPAVIELSSLDGTNGFTIPSTKSPVACGGDINHDGLGDFLVSGANAAYAVFGRTTGFSAALDVADLDGNNGFKIDGTGAAYEYSLNSAGDVNGDGLDDIIVGTNGSGAFVVFSSANFEPVVALIDLDGSNGFKIEPHGSDFTGGAVASAGDVNGDGYADIMVGAPNASPNGVASGEAYVIFGKASGFDATINRDSLDGSNGFVIEGGGEAVSSAGDINNDGFADLLIGAPLSGNERGATYVVFGKASGFSTTFALSSVDGTNGFRILGAAGHDNSGRSVASAGDVNGDGFADIIVGAPRAPNGYGSGAAYVVFGKASGFANIDLGNLSANNGFTISGIHDFGNAGFSVASAGDVNGDGFDDVIVGARAADPHGNSSGAAYVVFGKNGGFDAELSVSDLDGNNGFRLSGVSDGDDAGWSVSSAGDVNRDGFDDLLVGTLGTESYFVFGIAPDTAVIRIGTVASQTLAGGDFDDHLKGLGGNDNLFGNGGGDKLHGGHGNDVLKGGLGADGLKGGGGADVFVYGEASESTSANYDTILHANLAHSDAFDLTFHVTDVDTALASGALSTASFDTDLAAAVDAAHLGQDHAVLFTPDGGDLAGLVFLVIDANNTAGYQAGEDIVMHLEDATNLERLDVTDFI